MLKQPDLKEEELKRSLYSHYRLTAKDIEFLPLGADQDTAVFKISMEDHADYFLKLRKGLFQASSVEIPSYLYKAGILHIIPPITTHDGQLVVHQPPYRMILYPYVLGQNAFEKKLTDQQWIEFGRALKMIHTVALPYTLLNSLPRESYASKWRKSVLSWLQFIDNRSFTEKINSETANFLAMKRQEILQLVTKTENLAQSLNNMGLPFLVCHGDIHGWNLLITDDQRFFIVDWDTLILAPKERDLMFIGSSLQGQWRNIAEEEKLFFEGYGIVHINMVALAYYRYERIIEDIAVFCEQIFTAEKESDNRNQSLVYLRSNFEPGGQLEMAKRTDKTSE